MAVEEDAPCDVCKSREAELNNGMIFCDRCNVCVHQVCYGVAEIPRESWFCKPCELGLQPYCIFCLHSKGALKRTSTGKWAHVSCTLWIPEATFADPEKMETITNIDKIPKSRWNLSCFICRRKGGACIQCYVPKCKTAYHVTCAYITGLHMLMEDIESSESEVKFESFCKSHTVKLQRKSSITHLADEPITEKPKCVNDDQSLQNEVNIASTSTAVFTKDVLGVEKTTVENGNGAHVVENETELSHEVPPRVFIGNGLVSKGTARKSFPASTQKIDRTKKLSDILPKNVKTSKPRVRTKQPNEKSVKRKAKQSSDSDTATLELLPSSLNKPGTSRKKPKLDKQLPSNKTPQNLPAPNPSDSTNSAIRKLFPTPENQHKPIAIQNEHGLTTGNEPQTISSNHPPTWSGNQSFPTQNGNQSFPTQSGNQTPFVPNHHLPSTESRLQEVPRNDQLNSFLRYMETLLQALPLKRSLKLQGKFISYILKEHNISSSSDEISDVSSISD